jgi:hypothetical protein
MLLRYSSNPDIQEKLNYYLLLTYIPHYLFKLSGLHFNRVKVIVINATFNNISVISWRSVLFMEETTNLPQFTYKRYHSVVSVTPRHELDSN